MSTYHAAELETTPCPKCNAPSPLVDCVEVDIGVGVQTFEHEYACPTHGCFAFVYDEALHRSRAVFRDEFEADQSKSNQPPIFACLRILPDV